MLNRRCILKFVNQYVFDAVVEDKRKIGWGVRITQRAQRRVRQLREVHDPVALKEAGQLHD